MNINEKEFFHQATIRICGSLDIETAMLNCFDYLKEFIPMTHMILALYDPDVAQVRTFTSIEHGKVKPGNLVFHLDDKWNRKYKDIWTKLKPVGADSFSSLNDKRKYDLISALQLTPTADLMKSSMLRQFLDLEGKRLGGLIFWEEGKNRHTHEHQRLLQLINDPLAIALSNALRYEEVVRLKDVLADDYDYLSKEFSKLSGEIIIGAEGGLGLVMDRVRRVSAMDTPVLLLGETGVGKEIIANAIHAYSNRNKGPFIRVNCGAIAPSLMNSELFGHEKGAFTGAVAQKRGLFERAHNGTIFLDEIGELELRAQVNLLRVLEEKEVERVGGTKYIPTNIRVIAATHRDLAEMVSKKQFRKDLYYRLDVFPIIIPALRHRKMDIPELIHVYVDQKLKDLRIASRPAFAEGVMDRLENYDWPGNVRELVNAVERELIVRKEEDGRFILRFEDLGLPKTKPPHPEPGQVQEGLLPLDELMKVHIEQALVRAKEKISGPGGAAEILKINPGTLRGKMRKLGISFGRKRRFP
jgi:transcriptional regulator with GAF, ATPase, and Fis domain